MIIRSLLIAQLLHPLFIGLARLSRGSLVWARTARVAGLFRLLLVLGRCPFKQNTNFSNSQLIERCVTDELVAVIVDLLDPECLLPQR
ncbi:hypothetical protein BN903_79 [Halorubrum sp. AJ67]|nr:hypothetical protein BN903_79 [Halorubrum sp. AJ67]